jgi:hypothetical protein
LILNKLRLNGIEALTDETGMLQHSKYSTVDRKEGYTTDDNARALIATLRYYRYYGDQESLRLANIFLTFLLHMQMADGRFHNLLGFDRRFRDEVGSEDCIGRGLWASGYTLSSEAPKDLRSTAKEVFDRGLPAAHGFTSPRAIAFTILGLCCYQEAFPDDGNVQVNIVSLTRRLTNLYQAEALDNWHWFEPYLTYSNARLPQALLAAYESTSDGECLRVAKSSLAFLVETQMVNGTFAPIGTKGWYKRGGVKAMYDQQPIEASCMVEAALTAFDSTGDREYNRTALAAFEWYHGGNTQGLTLYNEGTGTCYDGITPEGVNRNQGAESTLSYYLAYLKLKEHNLV